MSLFIGCNLFFEVLNKSRFRYNHFLIHQAQSYKIKRSSPFQESLAHQPVKAEVKNLPANMKLISGIAGIRPKGIK
jgi:hypothetical protein